MTTDGPAALRKLADDIRKNDNLRFTAQLIDNFAHDWDAERKQAADMVVYLDPGHKCSDQPVCIVCALRSAADKLRVQAAEDRAALEKARALLKKICIFRYDGMDCCVMCDTPIIDGHAPGCELAAALSGAR